MKGLRFTALTVLLIAFCTSSAAQTPQVLTTTEPEDPAIPPAVLDESAALSGAPVQDVLDAAPLVGTGAIAGITHVTTAGAPVVIPDVFVTFEDEALVVAAPGPLANDYDPDGDTFIMSNVGAPSNGTLTSAVTSGAFTYEPDPGFTGTDSFVYLARDSDGNFSEQGTVTIEVVPDPNRPPVAVADFFGTLQDEALVVAAPGPLANDYDPDGDTFIMSNVGAPSNGTLTSAVTSGAFTYDPDPGFTGTDSFVYIARDSDGNFSEQSVVTIFVGSPPIECSATVLAETVGTDPQTGAGQVTSTFTNPDGIIAITFTLLDNFTVSSTDLTDVGGGRWEATGSPTEVTATLTQADLSEAEAAYFALAESVCPTEADGTLETDFDPPHAFEALPQAFAFAGNYPNPFGAQTTLRFDLPETADVRLAIYDVMGRKVATLVDGSMEAGRHEVMWQGRGRSGVLASGVYFARLEAGTHTATRRLAIVR